MFNFNKPTTIDRLEEILESIDMIQEWSKNISSGRDFLLSQERVMAFNACVMRLQVIGEHVGRLLKTEERLLSHYPQIPWPAIYNLRNIISHEYSNIDEDLIYSIIRNDLPKLRAVISEAME